VNPALALPALAVLAALLLPLPWLAVAPNRLLPGEPVAALAAIGWPVALAVPLILAALPRRAPPAAAAFAALAAALLLLGATGLGAGRALEGMSPAARAGFGAGFWLALLATLVLAAARAAALRPAGRAVLAAGFAASVLLLFASGLLEPLSLMVEYRARSGAVHTALLRHLWLSGLALLLALLVAAPLAFAAFRLPRLAGPLGALFAGVQVVPGLALFALLIPILAALLAAIPSLRAIGLSAIGAAPAVLATACYLTLPLWRSVSGGLAAADPAAVAAAQAIGMTEGRVTREVRLPLALPVFAGGLRVAVVQAIGLMTLGGLVGAGGLGALVFEGLAQFATDLMLLGALPVVALALLADALARVAEQRLALPA
jgi:osmoprotectant transport system permease protein